MKKVKNTILFLVLLSIPFLYSCSSDDGSKIEEEILLETEEESEEDLIVEETEETEEESEENPVEEEETTICTGNGSQDILPLAIGNSWYFKAKPNGLSLTIEINEKTTINEKEYFRLEYNEGGGFNTFERLLRKDTNGDIYILREYLDENYEEAQKEYLYLPADPSSGQEWEYFGNFNNTTYIKKVLTRNHSFDTDKCEYTNAIIINRIATNTRNVISTEIYVKGIGLVEDSYLREFAEVTLN